METLNLLGQACPLPVVASKKKLAEVPEGTELEIAVDGDAQVQNLSRMANNYGYPVSSETSGDHRIVHITKTASSEKAEDESSSLKGREARRVIVVGADHMGEGNDELGKVLMKSFIFSATQMDPLPTTMIFYNGGVKLTTEGSPCLQDLQAMAEAGVRIFSCGTCLNYLNLSDKLKVGEVSNMYDILEMQMKADVIIRP